MDHSNIEQTVYIRAIDPGFPCKVCGMRSPDYFSDHINHYLDAHDFVILHVGQESRPDGDGASYGPVALLGWKDPDGTPKSIRRIFEGEDQGASHTE